jgi:uncharacterized protein YegP (UPF0339 family)
VFVIYRDNAGEYRWRLVDTNGRTVGDSGEGYQTRDGAHRAVANVKALGPIAPIKDL